MGKIIDRIRGYKCSAHDARTLWYAVHGFDRRPTSAEVREMRRSPAPAKLILLRRIAEQDEQYAQSKRDTEAHTWAPTCGAYFPESDRTSRCELRANHPGPHNATVTHP